MPHRPRLMALAGFVLVGAAACGTSAPATATRPGGSAQATSTAPAGSLAPAPTPPVPGLSWVKAPDVARPDDAFAEPSGEPSGPSGPGTAGHPGHFPGQAIVDDVVAVDAGLVAVGYVGIDGVWTALAWRTADPEHWSLQPIDDAPASFAVAVVADPVSGAAYAAGRSGPVPVVWAAAGDDGWIRVELPTLSNGAAWERATAIAATRDGLLVGGSVGPELGERQARFWRSPDGSAWTAVADDEGFAGAEVAAIEPRPGGGYVAVGRLGRGQRSTGSVALLSEDGTTWRRVDDPALARGLVSGLATDADGAIVAVGSDPDEREAMVWRSTDGAAWEAAPREDSRLYEPYKIRMTDVVETPGGLVAVGNYVGLQYGTATSWTATDWRTWTRAPSYPALGQGEMLAVTPGGPGLVSVGSFGAPDNYIPTIWLGEAPGG